MAIIGLNSLTRLPISDQLASDKDLLKTCFASTLETAIASGIMIIDLP